MGGAQGVGGERAGANLSGVAACLDPRGQPELSVWGGVEWKSMVSCEVIVVPANLLNLVTSRQNAYCLIG